MIAEQVRRYLLAAPLFLPLAAVVGYLLGGQWIALTVIALTVAVICKQWRILICSIFFVVISFLQDERMSQNENAFLHQAATEPSKLFCGTVERQFENGCQLKLSEYGVSVRLRGEAACGHKVGDMLKVRLHVQPLRKGIIPGMFDESGWCQSQGVAATAACLSAEYVGHPVSYASLKGISDDWRAALAAKLMQGGRESDSYAHILCALVLGDKSYSEPETVELFKKGGCLHIFAVSGLHVGLVSGILYFLLSCFLVKSRARTITLLLLTGLYVFMTGMAVPALRAYLMLSLILLGRELKRPIHVGNLWAAAALLILMLFPWQIHNAGFILSFMVYAAIVLGLKWCMACAPWFRPDPFIPRIIYNRYERALVKIDLSVRGLVMMSVCAWLVSLPITMLYFHTFNLWGVFTNIAITFLLMPTMLTGLLSLLPLIGAYVQPVALSLVAVLMSVVSFFAALPNAYLPLAEQRPANSVMCVDCGYGNSFTMIGNPGVLINCGHEQTAEFTTYPALFHAGFHPEMLILTRKSPAVAGGTPVMKHYWSELRVISAYELRDEAVQYRFKSGELTIIPAASEQNPTPIDNTSPIIYVKGHQRSILYIGDASLHTYQRVPDSMKQADIIICGCHSALPVTPKLAAELSPGAELILLPRAAVFSAEELPPESEHRIKRVGAEKRAVISD